MQETNLTQEQIEHIESHASTYLRVWVALLVLTILEYFYALWQSRGSFVTLVAGLMIMALIKAALVALYFMHLKYEGRWVYLWLVPAGFLVIVFITALYPDIGMRRSEWPDYPDEEEAATAPLHPGPAEIQRA